MRNINIKYLCYTQEEEAHFLRLVSVLHDHLVCDIATKEKREELHR